MTHVHRLIIIGVLGACGRSGGKHASLAVDITQPPSTIPMSPLRFQTAAGTMTVTTDAEFSASGIIGIANPTAWGAFSLAWGPGVEHAGSTLKFSDLAPRGLGVVIIANVNDDKTITTAIRGLEPGQHVRVSGWRCKMEIGGKAMGPVMKGDNAADTVVVFPTELQIDDTVYTPASVPAGAK